MSSDDEAKMAPQHARRSKRIVKAEQVEEKDDDESSVEEVLKRKPRGRSKKKSDEAAALAPKGRSPSRKKRAGRTKDDDSEDQQPAKKKRRTSRTVASRIEEEEKGSEEERKEEMEVVLRVSPRKRSRRSYAESSGEESAESYESEEDEESEEDAVEDRKPHRSRGKKNKKKKARVDWKSLPESERSCPHCNKVFSSEAGRDGHVKHSVCRQTEGGGPVQKGRRRSTGSSPYPKIRGSKADRTCQDCGRVFTSVLGLNYHRGNKVCEKGKNKKAPFCTLETGERFVTPYGVVQVVKDDRAIPTAAPVSAEKQKKASRKESHQKSQSRQGNLSAAVRQRARRLLLQEAYEKKELDQASVFEAYGGDPRKDTAKKLIKKEPSASAPDRSASSSSLDPPGSFPDRMVECISIPDGRTRLYDLKEESTEDEASTIQAIPSCRLFLRRRLLTQYYNEDGNTYYCSTCGKSFLSRDGCKYHLSHGCEKNRFKNESQKEKERRLQTIEDRAIRLNERMAKLKRTLKEDESEEEDGHASPKPTSLAPLTPTRDRTGRFSVRPKREPEGSDEARFFDTPRMERKKDVIVKKEIEHPDVTLAMLKDQISHVRGKMLGPMYPGVFVALRYRRPFPPSQKKKQKSVPKKKKSKPKKAPLVEKPKPKPPPPPPSPPPPPPRPTVPPPVPMAPIIDTRVFLGEIEAGRFPSMKRFTDQHETKCSICKKAENIIEEIKGDALLSCNFCKRAVHLTCVRTKWHFKKPEPHDDFLCHRCVQHVINMRSRAEKRRIEKLGEEPVPVNNSEEGKARMQLTKGAVPGREYECVAEQGRQVIELNELLRDAQTRVAQNLCTVATNRSRLAMLESLEQLATL